MKMLHFVDAATTDETFVDSNQVTAIRVTDANTVIVYFNGVGAMGTAGANVGMDDVTITATAKSEVVALRLAEYMTATNPAGANVLTVKASTAPFTEISTVAYVARA